MKSILLVAPNLPWPPTTGGDLLQVSFVTALQREDELHLLSCCAAGQTPATIDPPRPYFRTIEVLAGTRETLLADEPARRALGAAGRAWHETRFGLPALTRALTALYGELIP